MAPVTLTLPPDKVRLENPEDVSFTDPAIVTHDEDETTPKSLANVTGPVIKIAPFDDLTLPPAIMEFPLRVIDPEPL